ncbi:MAG: hypothetical protein IPK23_15135 [Rhizobiales bacterium]|nr:hypothetical protein [Hyphomicrobiales bacterium]
MQGAALGLVGVGLTAAGALAKGKGASDSLSFQSEQATRNARAGRVAADQTDAFLRDELESTVSHIKAIRASAGMKDSPTSEALIDKESDVSDSQRRIKVGNMRAQADDDDRSAAFLHRAARSTLNLSYLSAAGIGIKGMAAR